MDNICKFWKSKQGCRKGDQCKWVHTTYNMYPEWKPKLPIAIHKIPLVIEKRPVIIEGSWADVEDDDPFF